MDALTVAMENLVSVSAFNKGEAGAIFSSVKKSGKSKLVMRRNEPECILMSPTVYAEVMNELEDLRDYKLAVERLASAEGNKCISFSEILAREGISLDDIEPSEDVELE